MPDRYPLPAPADVPAILAVSYGPGWRVPDPSFKHEPGPETVQRFDGWFSSLMRQRRDWEQHVGDLAKDPTHGASDFVGWVADRLPADARVVELGSGTIGNLLVLLSPSSVIDGTNALFFGIDPDAGFFFFEFPQ